MKVVILCADDWEGLFIDGKLIDEGHTLGEGNSRTYLLEKAEEFEFTSKDVSVEYVSEEVEEYLNLFGSFPLTIDKLKGNY